MDKPENPQAKTAVCKNCGFEDDYEDDELGLGYYQSVGICPECGQPTYIKGTDIFTKVTIVFSPTNIESKMITIERIK